MAEKAQSIKQFVKEQIKKWASMYDQEAGKEEGRIRVITVSMEPGSGGSVVAQKIAAQLGFDLFNRVIIEEIAKSAKITSTLIESLEKERLSGVEDFIASLIRDQYIHPDLYLEHLFKVVATIGKHGRAVIVGRGANFILPPQERLAVRIVAPLDVRIRNVAEWHTVSLEDAKRRIIARESRRRAFIRQSFNADISDPLNYDLTFNTGRLGFESAVDAVIGALMATTLKADT
jgi:cytidylate kinase